MNKTALDYAIEYAKNGWFVFPIVANTKVPPKDFEWRKSSTNNVDQIEQWSKRYLNCNWGLDCGASGLCVLDIDNKKGKKGSFELTCLEMEFGPIEKNQVIETVSGSFHYYFKGVTATSSDKIASGIDTRSDGGYVVIPGSSIDGKYYKVLKSEKIPVIPHWVLDKLIIQKQEKTLQSVVELDKPGSIKAARDYLKNRAEIAIEGQGGDSTAYKVSCMIKDFGISELVAFDLMSEIWNPLCQPPWSSSELKKKIENAYRYSKINAAGAESPENDFPTIEDFPVEETKKTNISEVLIPLNDFASISFPPREIYLHPWIRSQDIIIIYGGAGTGKTWLALSILKAISSIENFGPWKALKKVPVSYLDAEMTGQDVQDRLRQLNIVTTDPDFFIYSDALAQERGLKKANIMDENWRLSYEKALINRHIKISVLDNLASLSPSGDENTKLDYAPINQWLIKLRYHGITTILLHHVNKSGDQRGTSSRIDNVDFSVKLEKPTDYNQTDGARFNLKFEKGRLNHVDIAKIANIQMQLIQQDNQSTWQFSNITTVQKYDVLRLKSDGMSNKDIAAEIGCSGSNITKWTKKLRSQGYLSDTNDLTAAGLDYITQVNANKRDNNED